MPPRRSSRAPSVSTEAPPAETLPAKRKRGQSVQPNAEEKENVVKPASRTRRSSVKPSAPPPVAPRKSTRSKPSLPDVAESDAEEQSDAPPPVKRARPSVENKAEGHAKSEPEEGSNDIPKPQRGKRGASVVKSTPAPEMDVDEEPPSKPASRRTSSRTTAVSSGSRASVGSSKASLSAHIEEEEAEGSQEENVKPTKGRRAPPKSGKKASSKAVQSSDEDEMSVASEEYHEEEGKPARKGRKGKTPAARKGKAPAKQAPKAKVIEESDDEMEAPPSGQPRPKSTQAVDIDTTPSEMPAAVEEDEEERSLFDPLPLPTPSSLPNTMPEEPASPKSRLVIHKMALINFKSYAGRQEIGPFHKVNISIFNAPL